MRIIAIDPGPVESAFVIWDGEKIYNKGILPNRDMEYQCSYNFSIPLVIEQVECYGMPVGKSIFETVYWTGRFCASYDTANMPKRYAHRMSRKDVKMHLCQSMRAKDSNITQALVDRFAPFEKNKGKGTKKEPGFFYGFKSDIWAAMALAVTYWDKNREK